MMATKINSESADTVLGLNILLVGNNPMEMGYILDKINQVYQPKINVEIAFNLRTMLIRLIEFEPHYVLMDDNIGKAELKQSIHVIAARVKDNPVPITILKNSNYEESVITSSALDYILKQNFSMDLLMYGFKNFLKNRKTQFDLFCIERDVNIRFDHAG